MTAWATSAVLAALLVALSVWRGAGDGPVRWWWVVLAWAGLAVVVQVLLHNQWMRRLDARCRAVLSARRERRRGRGPRPPRERRRRAAHSRR